MTIHCPSCKDTGMTYEGNGHRMAGYPYAEQHVAVACGCRRPLVATFLTPFPEVPELTEAALAGIERRKVAVAQNLDRYTAKLAREINAIARPEPQWLTDRRNENMAFNAWAGHKGETT